MNAEKQELKYVVVTTEHRGVFGGYLVSHDDKERNATLTDCRNCIYWSSDVNGFGGLAVVGPIGLSRIGPAVPEITLYKVTAVLTCSPEAKKVWATKK